MWQRVILLCGVVIYLPIIFTIECPVYMLLIFSSNSCLFLSFVFKDCRPCHSFHSPALQCTPHLCLPANQKDLGREKRERNRESIKLSTVCSFSSVVALCLFGNDGEMKPHVASILSINCASTCTDTSLGIIYSMAPSPGQ